MPFQSLDQCQSLGHGGIGPCPCPSLVKGTQGYRDQRPTGGNREGITVIVAVRDGNGRGHVEPKGCGHARHDIKTYTVKPGRQVLVGRINHHIYAKSTRHGVSRHVKSVRARMSGRSDSHASGRASGISVSGQNTAQVVVPSAVGSAVRPALESVEIPALWGGCWRGRGPCGSVCMCRS